MLSATDEGVFVPQAMHFAHAPIVEAVIEFRADLPADFPVERLANARDALRARSFGIAALHMDRAHSQGAHGCAKLG